MKKILLDVDEVICFSGFLEAVNDFMSTNYEIDDFTDYYIDEVVIPKERFNEFNGFVNDRNFSFFHNSASFFYSNYIPFFLKSKLKSLINSVILIIYIISCYIIYSFSNSIILYI